MSAARARDVSEIEELLYRWGDEMRARADELAISPVSGIARMIEQQRVFEGRRRGGGRRKRRVGMLRDNAKLCECGCIFIGRLCPRCEEAPAISAQGSQTRSFKPRVMTGFSSQAATIEAIVGAAPNWAKKLIFRKFLYQQRDHKAAQDLRITKVRYREQVDAAVEYVGERLVSRSGEVGGSAAQV